MKNTDFKDIPNSLQKYRRARDLKQKEVAKILELKSTSQISRWERGVCIPKFPNIIDLAALYRTTTDALFTDLIRVAKNDIYKRENKVLNAKIKDDQ